MRTSSRTTSDGSALSASSAWPPVRDGGDKVTLPRDVAGQEHAVERLVVDNEDGCLSRDQVNSCSAARSAPSTRAYPSSIRGEQLGRGHERPRLRHRLELPTELDQPRRSEHLPIGLERVRRPTQLLPCLDFDGTQEAMTGKRM
jgi:hypothetical protein